MRIIVAPDKFKGSMTALEAAKSIARGIETVFPRAEILILPLSDGGEGLVESLAGTGGVIKKTRVTGPLGDPVEAAWGLINEGRTAVIEMAAASGLVLVPENRLNPLEASTYGTGELIRAALDEGCSHLIIGIGGSATNDGGAGMARALGVKFLDHKSRELKDGGGELANLHRVDISALDPRLEHTKIEVASDVDNPLTGPQGASKVYGPQKGATPEMVEQLEQAMRHYARVIEKDLGLDIAAVPGAGAAGGLGAGLIAFLKAGLRSGIDLVLDTLDIDRHLAGCFLLITGEGKLDAQSVRGKAPVGAGRRAARYGVPAVALAGKLEGSLEVFHREGITACFAIANGPLTVEESMAEGPRLLESKTAELMRLIKANKLKTGV